MTFFARLKAAAPAEWTAYTRHPFTDAMGDGTLAAPAFRHYLVQDYLFLIEFARAYALALYKSPTLADMREASAGIAAILDVEMRLHVDLCGGWGISPAALEQAPPAPEMLAYTRYVLDAGMRGDLLALKVALAPCVIGYAEIAARLAAQPSALAASNPYRVWIGEYAGAIYQQVAANAAAHLDRLAARYATPAREAELVAIFSEATKKRTYLATLDSFDWYSARSLAIRSPEPFAILTASSPPNASTMCWTTLSSGCSRKRLIASTMNVMNASQRLWPSRRSITENGIPEKPNGSMNANVGARVFLCSSIEPRTFPNFS